jgi:hypothetical protein
MMELCFVQAFVTALLSQDVAPQTLTLVSQHCCITVCNTGITELLHHKL